MARKITEKDIILPKRNRESRKGDNGTVVCVGGSEKYASACALSAIAALRSGADLVFVLAPEKVAWAINCLYPDIITIKLKGSRLGMEHEETIIEHCRNAECVVMGNGAGLSGDTKKLFVKLSSVLDLPKVIDADAIKAVSLKGIRNALFTPHKGEFQILLKNSGIDEMSLSGNLGDNVVLLKGKIDRIITKDSESINMTGNPGMTVGGTGDILAGLCGGFLAQGQSSVQSAINAAFIAGRCGDRLLQTRKWYSFIASDLLYEIESVEKRLKNSKLLK